MRRQSWHVGGRLPGTGMIGAHPGTGGRCGGAGSAGRLRGVHQQRIHHGSDDASWGNYYAGCGGRRGRPLQEDYVNTIRRVLPSVVEIKTASGLGSGVVYDTAGHIVTNAHVVGTATSFQVFMAGSAARCRPGLPAATRRMIWR